MGFKSRHILVSVKDSTTPDLSSFENVGISGQVSGHLGLTRLTEIPDIVLLPFKEFWFIAGN